MLRTDWVKLELSTRQIIFTPSDTQNFSRAGNVSTPDLEVIVTNTSQRFASFQLVLQAEGHTHRALARDLGQWYQVEPNASAKKPPGDKTTFHISLLKAPVPSYDTTIPITVSVVSAELATLEASETLYVRVLRPQRTLRVHFPVKNLKVYPGTRLQIPVLVYNLSALSRKVDVQLKSNNIPEDWFPEGIKKSLQIEAGGSEEVNFWCAPHPEVRSARGLYNITAEAIIDQENNASDSHQLEVLPFGQILASVTAAEPEPANPMLSFWQRRVQGNDFRWKFENQSNLEQQIFLQEKESSEKWISDLVADEPVIAPAHYGETTLSVKAKRPWLGWVRTRFIEIFPDLRRPDFPEDVPQVTVNPASQVLTLKVRPMIPLWVQLLVGVLGLVGFWWLWLVSPKAQHRAAVNSTALMANGDTVISGSRDQTLQRWQVNRAFWLPDVRRLRHLGQMGKTLGQAIRVVEPLPAGVKQVAVGLGNGEIQLWRVEIPENLKTLDEARADRVFDLAFTQDSRYLFSAHGSGRIRQWQMSDGQLMNKRFRIWESGLSSAITSIDVIENDVIENDVIEKNVEADRSLVAIAAQYNRLILWDWQKEQSYEVSYQWPREASTETAETTEIPPVVSQNSYLTSLDVAQKKNWTTTADDDNEQRNHWMATADSVGVITIWDIDKLRDCTNSPSIQEKVKARKQAQARERAKAAKTSQTAIDQPFPLITSADCPADTQIDQWSAGQKGSAIRQVALTDNGCFVASTGDNGHVRLWPLTKNGELALGPLRKEGIDIATFEGELLNSVDVHLTPNNVLLVAADTPGDRVQLYRKKVRDYGCQ